jgi:hypothetical protein
MKNLTLCSGVYIRKPSVNAGMYTSCVLHIGIAEWILLWFPGKKSRVLLPLLLLLLLLLSSSFSL